jgi:hypothetical protein
MSHSPEISWCWTTSVLPAYDCGMLSAAKGFSKTRPYMNYYHEASAVLCSGRIEHYNWWLIKKKVDRRLKCNPLWKNDSSMYLLEEMSYSTFHPFAFNFIWLLLILLTRAHSHGRAQVWQSLIVAKGIWVVYNSIIIHILAIVMPIATCLWEEGSRSLPANLSKLSEALKWHGLTEEEGRSIVIQGLIHWFVYLIKLFFVAEWEPTNCSGSTPVEGTLW